MRFAGLAVGMALALVLAGCLGSPATSTETSTEPPTTRSVTSEIPSTAQTCTMTGGYLIEAVPIDATNATDGEVVAYENLSGDHQDAFDRMLDGDYQGHPRTPQGFPPYVRYNGTVYEPREAGNWDRFC